MALQFMDGCDHYNTTAAAVLKWGGNTSLSSILATGGRFGGRAVRLLGISHLMDRTVAPHEVMIAGAARRTPDPAGANLFRFLEGSTFHVIINGTMSGHIQVLRGISTPIAITAAPVLASGVYQYIECKVRIHDTDGTVEIWVDGVKVMDEASLDTRNGATGVCDRVQFQAGNALLDMDDFYICNGDGPAPYNDRLGGPRVDLILPDGDGFYTEFGTTEPDDPSTHFDKVNEGAPDGDTSYNESDTVDERDTFEVGAVLPLSSQTIYGIQQFSYARFESAAANIRHLLRLDGTDYAGSQKALGSAYGYHLDVWEEDPDEAAPWDEGGVNALETGYEHVS